MIRIITDSAADFEPWELEKMNVTCIPLAVTFGNREYRENVDLTKNKFYELLEKAKELPKTSQPSPQALLEVFEDVKEQGDEAVYICLSSGISGTYQSAVMTKNLADCDRCYVVDSLSGTAGQRILVEQAVKMRDAGSSAAQIVAAIEALRSRITLFACMDTLENLYRGGRISQSAYTLGTMAQIKPIIQLAGAVTVPAKAMGMRKAADYLCKQADKTPMDPDYPVYIMYTNNRQNGENLASRFRDMGFDIPDGHIVQVGAAIGTHVGANTVGYTYIMKE